MLNLELRMTRKIKVAQYVWINNGALEWTKRSRAGQVCDFLCSSTLHRSMYEKVQIIQLSRGPLQLAIRTACVGVVQLLDMFYIFLDITLIDKFYIFELCYMKARNQTMEQACIKMFLIIWIWDFLLITCVNWHY